MVALCQYPACSTEAFLTSCLTHRGRNANSKLHPPPPTALHPQNTLSYLNKYWFAKSTELQYAWEKQGNMKIQSRILQNDWAYKNIFMLRSKCVLAYFMSFADHLLCSPLLKRGHVSGLPRQQEQHYEDPVFQSHDILQAFTQVAVIWVVRTHELVYTLLRQQPA